MDVILTSRCQRQYSNGHAYHINSISCASDNATFMSADDLRINLWHLEVGAQAFNIVDIKPTNMEDLTEVGMPYSWTMSHITCVEAVSWALGWCCAREGDCHHPILWFMLSCTCNCVVMFLWKSSPVFGSSLPNKMPSAVIDPATWSQKNCCLVCAGHE